MIKINLKRVAGDFGFEATDASGHVLKMDTSTESGGVDFGIRPMQVLLMGMGGCSGIDIVMILQKQRQTIVDFSMHIEQIVRDKKISYMDAVLQYCKENFIEPEDVAKRPVGTNEDVAKHPVCTNKSSK
jgi:uncharacterized OsmC-like protein